MQGKFIVSSSGSRGRGQQGTATHRAIVAYLVRSRASPASSADQGTATTPTPTAVVAPSRSPASHSCARRLRRGPFPGARARSRAGVLNPDLVSKSAAKLVDFLESHNASTYAFEEVGLVLRERDRRLSEAEEVVSSRGEGQGGGGRWEQPPRQDQSSRSEPKRRRGPYLEAESVVTTLRDEVRARDLRIDAAEARVLEAEAAAACLGVEMRARELLLFPPRCGGAGPGVAAQG
jgi:hypothetical protein